MKQVTPNLTDVLTTQYISNLGKLRKFARYWGKTTIDGVEVFLPKKHYYPQMDDSVVKLSKMLGVYNDIKVKPEGIRSAWFYFNADKAKDSNVHWDRTVLVNNFNRAFKKDLECTVIIGPRVDKKTQKPADITSSILDQTAIINEIKSKYNALWDAGHTFSTSENDPYLSLLATYVLRTDDIPYEVVTVEKTVSTTYRPTVNAMDRVVKSDQVPAWRVRLLIPLVEITSGMDLLDELIADGNATTVNAMTLIMRERLKSAATPATSDDGNNENKPDELYEALPVTTGEFWHTALTAGEEYDVFHKYLKTSILTTPSLNNAETLHYILSCVDTGYRKKKRKWYEVVIAIIIVVVAVWFAGPAGLTAASSLGLSGAVLTVVAVSVTLTVASMYVSLAALALSHMGAENIASALAQHLKTLAPLTRIASVITALVSIFTVIQRGIEQAVAEAAKEGVKNTLKSVISSVAGVLLENIAGLTKLSNMTMSHITKMLTFSFNIYKNLSNRDLQREINNYRREIATLAEVDEKAKTSDLVRELMSSYPNPLSNDWSYYAELYDRPYEWWATPYHTGNIQATTVNALWLNEPQNAILYNNSTGAS